MDGDNTVALAVIGLIGTVITALFKLLNDNTKALNKMTTASDKIAAETAKGNREAKQRNGHLGEQNIQISDQGVKLAELITGQNRDIAAIRISSEKNAETNLKAVEVLETTAVTLAENTKIVGKATKEVADALKKADASSQVIDQQTVVHQLVKNKE